MRVLWVTGSHGPIVAYTDAVAPHLARLCDLHVADRLDPSDFTAFDRVVHNLADRPELSFHYELARRHPGVLVLHDRTEPPLPLAADVYATSHAVVTHRPGHADDLAASWLGAILDLSQDGGEDEESATAAMAALSMGAGLYAKVFHDFLVMLGDTIPLTSACIRISETLREIGADDRLVAVDRLSHALADVARSWPVDVVRGSKLGQDPAATPVTRQQSTRSSPRPFLSIVVPTWNRRELVEKTIESVLAQDDDDFELVVIDDASEDDTWSYLQSIANDRIRVERNTSRVGLGPNVNRSIALSRGEYVFILHDDDLVERNLVSTIAAVTTAQPEADIVVFATCLIDASGENREYYWSPDRDWRPELVGLLPPPVALLAFAGDWQISSGQVVFARRVFERYGGKDESLPIGSDAELILRWMFTCQTLVIPDVLAVKRHWDGSTSAATESSPEFAETMRGVVDRITRRAEGSDLLTDAQRLTLREDLQKSFLTRFGL